MRKGNEAHKPTVGHKPPVTNYRLHSKSSENLDFADRGAYNMKLLKKEGSDANVR